MSCGLRNSNVSSIFVRQLEKLWTRKLFVFWKPTTLVLDKNSFELYFRNYFQSRLVWNLTDKLNLWTLRFKGPVILCSNFYFLSLTSTRRWFNMMLVTCQNNFICKPLLVCELLIAKVHKHGHTYTHTHACTHKCIRFHFLGWLSMISYFIFLT